jgi:hypothetical protein
MILSEGRLDIFYTSPAAMTFFSLAILIVGLQIQRHFRLATKARPDLGSGQA